jgi:hypothetical protein
MFTIIVLTGANTQGAEFFIRCLLIGTSSANF